MSLTPRTPGPYKTTAQTDGRHVAIDVAPGNPARRFAIGHDDPMPLDPSARALIDAADGVFPRLDDMADAAEARRRIAIAMADMVIVAPVPDRKSVV